MRIASRFSIAVHILSLLEESQNAQNTSEWMAGSIGVNPVIVRNITGMLRRANIVQTQQGVAGARLAKPLAQITLLDVYQAVEDEKQLFAIHPRPNPNCPVGRNIQATLETVSNEAQAALEARLAASTMQDIVHTMQLSAAQLSEAEPQLC